MKKNIVFITIDCFNQKNLTYLENFSDFFKKEGVLFNNAYSTAPWTPLSFKSMFQSVYPSMLGGEARLGKIPTFVEILQKNGYKTIGIPQTVWLSKPFGYNKGFESFVDFNADYEKKGFLKKVYYGLVNKNPLLWSVVYDLYLKNEIKKDEMIEKIVQKSLRYPNDGPIFLWVHYMLLHDPHIMENESILKKVRMLKKYKAYIRSGDITITKIFKEADMNYYKEAYKKDIQYLDLLLMKLFNLIDDYLSLDCTTIIFTADHGQSFGDHRMFTHGVQLYDELIHVPLMVYDPDCSKIEDGLSSLIDLPPTILDIASLGNETPVNYQGSSFLDKGCFNPNRPYVIAEEGKNRIQVSFRDKFKLKWGVKEMKVAIRNKEWKYIVYPKKGTNELFYIKKDVGEKNNLKDEFPEVVKVFQKKYENHLAYVSRKNNLMGL